MAAVSGSFSGMLTKETFDVEMNFHTLRGVAADTDFLPFRITRGNGAGNRTTYSMGGGVGKHLVSFKQK